jgi:hypothetical protein
VIVRLSATAASFLSGTGSNTPADTSPHSVLWYLFNLDRWSRTLPVEAVCEGFPSLSTSCLAIAGRLTQYLLKAHPAFGSEVGIAVASISAASPSADVPENGISLVWAKEECETVGKPVASAVASGNSARTTMSTLVFLAGACVGDARFEESSMHKVMGFSLFVRVCPALV